MLPVLTWTLLNRIFWRQVDVARILINYKAEVDWPIESCGDKEWLSLFSLVGLVARYIVDHNISYKS